MRLLQDWITEFVGYTEHLPSPEIFRKWSGIAAVAGALERKVWIRSLNRELYPHLYTVLVGPPGVGKSVMTSLVEELWRSLTTHKVAPKSLTKAALIDALAEAKRTKAVISANSLHLDFNSLLVNAGELGVLLPAYDADFMAVLTDIWDAQLYEERRRGKDLHITIKRPQLNIIAGCTPSYLNGMLPEGAWEQGFLARTFLIFSGESIEKDVFSEDIIDIEQYNKLKSDLRDISDAAGQIGFTTEAKAAIRGWQAAGLEPKPIHPRLSNYLSRRMQHVLKLSMIASMSASPDKVITLEHYQTALGWLLEMESRMTDIFKALGARGDGQHIEEAYHFVFQIYMARKEPVAEHRLIAFLSERVPSYSVLRIIDLMEKSGQIEKQITPTGVFGYVPLTKGAI